MRYRFSLWDVGVLLLAAAQIYAAFWMMGRGAGPIPRNLGVDGSPTGYNDANLSLIGTPLFMLLFYIFFRLLDGFMAFRKPEFYGFLTNVGGGVYGMVSLLNGLSLVTALRGAKVLSPFFVIGFFFGYLGWLLIRTPDIPMNSAGLWADTRENRDRVRRSMGRSFELAGLLTVGLGALPGNLAALALVPLIGGPLAGILLAVTKTK